MSEAVTFCHSHGCVVPCRACEKDAYKVEIVLDSEYRKDFENEAGP